MNRIEIAPENELAYASHASIMKGVSPNKYIEYKDLFLHDRQEYAQLRQDLSVSGFVPDLTGYIEWVSRRLLLIKHYEEEFIVHNLHLGGSKDNRVLNQFFEIDLGDVLWSNGESLELFDIEFRGDFSGANEFVSVGFDLVTNNKTEIADFVSSDSSEWMQEEPETVLEAKLVEANGKKVIRMYVNVESAVNYAPNGMSNWWELRASVRKTQ